MFKRQKSNPIRSANRWRWPLPASYKEVEEMLCSRGVFPPLLLFY